MVHRSATSFYTRVRRPPSPPSFAPTKDALRSFSEGGHGLIQLRLIHQPAVGVSDGATPSLLTSSPIQKRLRVNHQIRAPEVRVIDENNQQIGVVKLQDALRMARERGFDLVEVSPVTQPPVCRILDYGKYLYQQERLSRENRTKQRKIEVKGIRLSLKIGQHDMEVRQAQSRKFLDVGHKVKIELILRGRENAHQDRAKEIIRNFITSLGEGITIEQDIGRLGNRFIAIIGK